MFYATITFHLENENENKLNDLIDDIIKDVDLYPYIDIWAEGEMKNEQTENT